MIRTDIDNEALKQEWTDQYVEVNAELPELKRFAGLVGRVITVNRNQKALVDFARRETDPALKREIVSELSRMQSKEATDYLMELLK